METIGQRIAKLRDIRAEEIGDKFTQQDLADAMGVEKGTIYKWEHDLVSMNAEKIDQLSSFFNVSCDYLVRGGAPDHLMLIDETGLSHETISILSAHKLDYPAINEVINVLVKDIPLLIVLHSYLFSNNPEYTESTTLMPSQERVERLCVMDMIVKLREEVYNGKS